MTIKRGSRGKKVVALQQRLQELGYTTERVTGRFGAGTAEAVRWFQHTHGFETDGLLTDEQLELLSSNRASPAPREETAFDPREIEGIREINGYIGDALDEDREEVRRQIIGSALLEFGLQFVLVLREYDRRAPGEAFDALSELTTDVLLSWLNGASLTDRADEDELRALVALDFLDLAGPGAVRLAAKSLLALPDGHPLRDTEALRDTLMERGRELRDAGELEDYVLFAETMLSPGLLAEADVHTVAGDLLRLAYDPPDVESEGGPPHVLSLEDRTRALIAVATWHTGQSIHYRDTDPSAAAVHRAISEAVLEKLRMGGMDARYLILQAIQLDESGRQREAADLLASLEGHEEMFEETAARLEGLMRVNLGDYERAAKLLERVVPVLEESYLLAIGDETIRYEGQQYAKFAVNLAFACACLDRWADALVTLDRSRSTRLRHHIQLRQSAAGARLLKLEARLAAARRGVPDSGEERIGRARDYLDSRLSTVTRALERYRKLRPDLGTTRPAQPTLPEIGSLLTEGEAIVSFGSGFKGLMIIFILPGDSDRPSGTLLLEEWPDNEIVGLLLDEPGELSGWGLEMAALEPVNPEPALDAFLRRVDEAFGKRVSSFLLDHRVRRVTIIPHRVLHGIPFWALPSFRDLEVRTAPSLAQWYVARQRVARLGERATSVGNPTLDLGLASAEAESVSSLLGVRGITTELLLDDAAHESAIRESVRGSSLLHFAGHGRARPMNPLLSSLLTHPDPNGAGR